MEPASSAEKKPGLAVPHLLYGAALLALVIRGHVARVNWRTLIGPPPRLRDLPLLAIIVPLALLTAGAIPIVFVPVSYFAPDLVQHLILGDNELFHVTTFAQYASLAVLLVVAAPVVEELLFRGMILHRLARRFSVPVAVMVSSFLFAIPHAEWVGHCITGIGFALVYLRTRSLWMSMLAHATYNALFTIPIGWALLTHDTDQSVQSLHEFRGSLGTGVATFVAGMFLMYLYLDLYWPNGRVAEVVSLPLPHDDPRA